MMYCNYFIIIYSIAIIIIVIYNVNIRKTDDIVTLSILLTVKRSLLTNSIDTLLNESGFIGQSGGRACSGASLSAGCPSSRDPLGHQTPFKNWTTVTFPLFSRSPHDFARQSHHFPSNGAVLYASAWFASTKWFCNLQECPLGEEMDPSAGNRSAEFMSFKEG